MRLPRKAAVITFDDGYRDVYTHAYPILKKLGAPATVFLPTAYVGGSTLLWWDRVGYAIWKSEVETLVSQEFGSLSLASAGDRVRSIRQAVIAIRHMTEGEGARAVDKVIEISGVRMPVEVATRTMLSWDEIEEMSNNGVEFGAHTHNHRKLAGLSVEETRHEITRSKNEIEERLGKRVASFAYPHGGASDFDSQTISVVRESGFECAVSTIRSMVSRGADPYRLGRVGPGFSLDSLKVVVSGLHADTTGLLMRGSEDE
jgi:peptidoglycan/xylan/chitin deacetylase (PgdA/CDA1 family)